MPFGITAGPDGNIWFTEAQGNALGRITRASTVTTFRLPLPSRGPQLIITGPDGNLWFTETAVNRIGRITPSGKLTEFRVPTDLDPTISTPAAFLGGIAAGPDGNIWFTEGIDNRICRMTLAGKVTVFHLPVNPNGQTGDQHAAGLIIAGPKTGPESGVLWFTDNQAGDVGRITPSGKIQEFAIRQGSDTLVGLAAGPDGNVWVSDARANEIHAVGPTGTTTDYNANEPIGLTAGPHGSIWYTEVLRNSIGRITLGAGGGSQQEFPLPTDSSSPLSIAAGADGNLWFTESATDQIGRITPGGAVTEFPAQAG